VDQSFGSDLRDAVSAICRLIHQVDWGKYEPRPYRDTSRVLHAAEGSDAQPDGSSQCFLNAPNEFWAVLDLNDEALLFQEVHGQWTIGSKPGTSVVIVTTPAVAAQKISCRSGFADSSASAMMSFSWRRLRRWRSSSPMLLSSRQVELEQVCRSSSVQEALEELATEAAVPRVA
jgi:hypothetical protein